MATDGLSELAAALRADGVLDSEGRFTLDRAEARAKMQKFQLADARRYVLELVQAALLRGASALDLCIDADDMILRFDGLVFTPAELDDLWGSIFAEGEGRELRGLRQLALGLNAALALQPRLITVESGAHRLLIRPSGDDELAPAEPRPDTRIHVKQRARLGLVLDFFRDLRGRLPEETHVRERCVYASAPITLDGAPIADGMALPAAIDRVPIEAPGLRGVIGWTADGRPAELRLVKDGVWIDSRPLARCGPGIVAVIESDALRRDASLAKIVDDEALAQALAQAYDARWTLLAALLKRPLPVAAQIRDEVLDHLVPGDLTRLPAAQEVAAAITWPDARAAWPRAVTLPELSAALVPSPRGPALRYARGEHPLVAPTGPPIPRMNDREARRVMRTLECSVLDVGPELAQQQAREAGRRAFLRRTMAPRLPEFVRAPLRAIIDAPALRGEVGIDVDAEQPGELWLIRDGCLIVRCPLDVHGIYAALEAEFSPSDDFSDVVRDQVFAAALLRGLASLGPTLQEVAASLAARPAGRALLKAWLGWTLDDEARGALWSRLGVPDSARPRGDAAAPLVPTRAELLAMPGLQDAPLFEDYDGTRRSLGELRQRAAREGALAWIDRGVPRDAQLGLAVAYLGRGDQRLLAALLGADALRAGDPELASARAARAFAARPTRTIEAAAAELHADLRRQGLDPALGCRRERVGDVEVVLQVLPSGPAQEARVEVIHDARALGTVLVRGSPLPCAGAASAPQVRPNAAYDGIVEDDAAASLRAAALRAAFGLARQLLGGLAADSEPRVRLLRQLRQRLEADDHESLLRALPELWALPLLGTLAGDPISLDAIRGVIAARGVIEWVPERTAVAPLRDPPLLRVGGPTLALLLALFGPAALVEGTPRVLQHRLADLPAVATPTLAPARVWQRIALQVADGASGEIGLSRARSSGGLSLALCTGGRLVATARDEDLPAPVEAIVADPRLPLMAGGVDTRSKRYSQHLRRCRRALPGLIRDLCQRYAKLAGPEREQARAILLGYAGAKVAQAHGAIREEVLQQVRALPLLRDLWGAPRTLAEAAAAAKVEVVSAPREVDAAWAELGQLILVADPPARRCLEALTSVVDVEERFPAVVERLRALAAAPSFSPQIPGELWIEREVASAGGLEAHLWLPRADEGSDSLAFVHAGREVARLALIPGLPCGGVVRGPTLACDERSATLDERQRSGLVRQIYGLYEALARQVKSGRMRKEERAELLGWLIRQTSRLPPSDPSAEKALARTRSAIEALRSPALRRIAAAEDGTPTPKPAAPPAELPAPKPEDPTPGPALGRAGAADPPARLAVPAAPATPRQTLLAALHAELAWARARHHAPAEAVALDRITLDELPAKTLAIVREGLVVRRDHPLVDRCLSRLAHGEGLDPIDLMFLVSAIYTVMNETSAAIDADDEQALVAHIAACLAPDPT